MGVGPTSRSSMVPGWKGGKALPFGGSFGEYSLNDFEEQPGRTEGVRGGAGSAWESSGTLARVRTKVEPTSAAHVPSGTGRSGWELHSAGRTKTRMHSLRPPRGVHSPGGKLQWPLGRGLGAGGPAWGAGGRGESGAFFVCKVSLNNGCSALSSLLLLLLGSARRRLSLPLPPSSPPALPRPPGPSAGEAAEAGPGTHTHSHWHTQTHAAPACSALLILLALLLCGVTRLNPLPTQFAPFFFFSRRSISPVRLPPPLLLSWCRCRAFPPRRPRSLWPRPPWVFLLKVTTSLFKNSAEKEKTLYPTLWAVISRRTF